MGKPLLPDRSVRLERRIEKALEPTIDRIVELLRPLVEHRRHVFFRHILVEARTRLYSDDTRRREVKIARNAEGNPRRGRVRLEDGRSAEEPEKTSDIVGKDWTAPTIKPRREPTDEA